MELNLVRLYIDIEPESFASIASLVSGKGTGFEKIVRNLCCNHPATACYSCRVKHTCPVSVLLSRELSSDPAVVRRYQKPALPFVFSGTDNLYAGLTRIGLVLVGPACSYLSVLLAALEEMLGGKQNFRRIVTLDYQGGGLALELGDFADVATLTILSASELLSLFAQIYAGCTTIKLELKTPLRIVSSMRELTFFDPPAFCRTVVRRISALAAYYGDVADDYDLFRHLAERSCDVRLIKAYNNVTPVYGTVRGVTGCYELAGPFDLLAPYLMLASLLHVGKRASYGMGAFEITPIS